MSLADLERVFELDYDAPGDDEFDSVLDVLGLSWDELFAEVDFAEYEGIDGMGYYH